MRIRLFAEYLAKLNYTTSVLITNNDNGINKKFGEFNNVRFLSMTPWNLPYYLHILLYPFFAFFNIFKLRKKGNKNIIFIYGGIDFFTLPIILAGKILRFKIIIDLVEDRSLAMENLSIKAKLNLSISEFFLPLTINFCDGLVVISQHLKNKYKKINSIIPISLIPVSAANLRNLRTIHSADKDHINLVYSGSFGIKDGIDFLLKAFIEISKKYSSIRLTLIGTASKNIIQRASGFSNINITGYLDDEKYWQVLNTADILCMTRIDSPYANAGFPFKLGEYLATGKVVIASRVSDVSNYLVDKKDALIIEPSSSDSIIDAIDFYMKNKDEMSDIGKNGLKKCKQFFNPEINSKMLDNFIAKI